MLEHLKLHLQGKVVIVGIGNTLRCDDAVGALLAQRIKDKVSFAVYDAGPNPENYLGKIVKAKPDNVVLIDAVEFGGAPGEFREAEGEGVFTANLFSTHNASLSLTMNYLKNNLKADIIMLMVQPKCLALGDTLSPEIQETLDTLTDWFCNAAKEKG
jgi:hydrogenase 3 maturation protease